MKRVFLCVAASLSLSGCATPQIAQSGDRPSDEFVCDDEPQKHPARCGLTLLTERQAELVAYRKCGPEGTVDWDDDPEFPPPHCNRSGWNGRHYVGKKIRR